MRTGVIFIACLLLLLAISASAVNAAEPVVMVFGPGYPPFYWGGTTSDPDAQQGAFISFLAAFQKAHPEFPIKKTVLSRIRLDQWMESGQADAFSLNNERFVSPGLREQSLFTEPLWTTSDFFLVLSRKADKPRSLDDLGGHRIGTIRGNGYGHLEEQFASGSLIRVDTNSMESNLRMLKANRLDAVLINGHALDRVLTAVQMDRRDFTLIEPPVLEIPLSIQIKAERKDFYLAINEFIKESKENGLLQKLEAAYLRQ